MPSHKKTLIEILIERGFLAPTQLKEAEAESKKTGVPLQKILVKRGFIAEEDITQVMADQMGIPYMDLSNYLVDQETIKLIPESLARKYKIIPLFKIGKTLTAAMYNPTDIVAIDALRNKSGFDIEPALSPESAIMAAIDQYYGATGTVEQVIKDIKHQEKRIKEAEAKGKSLEEIAEEAPIIKLVNLLIMEAVNDGASDIHIEPEEEILRARFRIDGILHEIASPPKSMQSAIISRIKVLSRLDIAERRRPQDGRIQMKVGSKDIDIRVSTFPTVHGENVVMRILDKSNIRLDLKDLGFAPEMKKKYEELISHPHGIVLVTGPTGGGKTTTLYASLNTINSPEKNIITIEDPVEYQLEMIRQSQVNPKAGLTFANGLRSILRQDPDIIMVGEIRDKETAEIAINAALTGHLVFSTLHTNDAPGALARLIDMGIEPFLISSSIIGVLAQRLVRVICENCKESSIPEPESLEELHIGKGTKLYHGKGCKKCKDTGFKGRLGIFELMIINEDIRSLILKKASSDEIKKKARELGMTALREDGLKKVKNSTTTIEEVLKSTQEE